MHEIRDEAPGWEKEHGVDIAVTGLTAAGIDVSERLKDALLPFGLVVVGLSVLLLMVVFRSILVPVKATIGFILSTGASFGAVVAVFQWGWFNTILNVDQTGPLISFLPIMLMAVLFGLSMDYEVFLMSRMKEEYLRSDDPQRAIVDGFVGSSRVVTAAAVIMLAVFAAFVPDGDPDVKPIAFALAIGVFADAFLVRMLFAPAVLKLFGRSAWSLPRRLGAWLPHVDVEGEGLHERVRLESWPAGREAEAVSASALTLSGPDGLVYNDVSINLPIGERLIVHGPSGSGKSALLLTIAGRMAFDAGRLRVNGYLLPQETAAVRRSVALAEMRGVNDLDDNLTVDQLIAERLSIGSFSLWVSRSRVAPVRDELNDALEYALRSRRTPRRRRQRIDAAVVTRGAGAQGARRRARAHRESPHRRDRRRRRPPQRRLHRHVLVGAGASPRRPRRHGGGQRPLAGSRSPVLRPRPPARARHRPRPPRVDDLMPSPALPWFELARFGRSRLARAAVVAVTVIPLILAALYVWANIDPTGRLDEVKAAVVNQDELVEVKDRDGKKQPVAIGRELAGNLTSDDSHDNFDWVLTDAKDAQQGLVDGEYKAVLTIPENLSEAATSTSGDPQDAVQGHLKLRTNDAVNYVNGTIAESIAQAAKTALNTQVTETYLDNIYLSFSDMKMKLSEAAIRRGRAGRRCRRAGGRHPKARGRRRGRQ